ncbi:MULTISPECIES: AAA family ATPase [unclassified Saccharicrinis]|uniref:AAA family ATPase n=1 Tax=unclassified Saccharicrinis TaxID=2646859 RepID=UPI003D35539D
MIPITLTLEGLYSYQKRQTIDFNKLTSNHLFGIFGTVGSGKSSILEAITFALYGKTDRLLLSGDNRNYNMMNLKSNLLFIEFDFLAGKDSQAYRIQYTAKRNSKKYHDVKSSPRTFYKKKGEEYIPINEAEIENNIGLSYDNFKRTIIIPQGKFQEFLQLKSTDRTRMMKELFNLQKYELSPKVKDLELKNNANMQNLEGRLEQIGVISTEQLDDLKLQLTQVEKNITILSSLQKQKDQTVLAFDKLKENSELLEDLQNRKATLNQQKNTIGQLEKNLADYEYCLVNFKNTIDTLSLHKQKLHALKDALSLDSQTLKEKQIEHHKLQAIFTQLSDEFNGLDALKREAENLKKLVEVKRLNAGVEEGTQRLKNGEKTVAHVLDTIHKLEQEEKIEQASLTSLKRQLPDIEIINQAQQWHLKENNIAGRIDDATLERNTLIGQTNRLEEEIQNKLNEQTLPFSPDNKPLLIQGLSKKLKEEEKELKLLNDRKEHLLIQSGLEKYAKELNAGEACPLCGSEHHPKPLNSNKISNQINQLKNKTDKQEKIIQQTRKLNLFIDKQIAGINTVENQLKNIDIKINSLKKERETHQKGSIKIYQDKQQLDKSFETYRQVKKQIETSEAKLIRLKDTLSKETKNKERYQTVLSEIQRDLDKNINSKELLEGQLPGELIIKHRDDQSEIIIERSQKLESKISEINTNYEKTRKLVEDNQNTMSILQGKIDVNQKHLETESKQNSLLETKLNKDVEKSDYKSIDHVLSLLKLDLDIEASKHKIEAYHHSMQSIDSEIQKLTKEMGEKKYEAEKHMLAIAQAKDIKEKLTEANRQHGKTQSILTDLTRKLILQKDLKEQLNKLQLRAADIDTLRKLFYKSGFVNYVSSVYLQNLCATANERFYKMTRQTLSLELSEDNNFEVRDYMNGGKLRSVKTLSGGQTFQAALALALALADNIQRLTETERNFFFLDEGFGSLDKESLNIVFGTLKNLRKENRIVGVISHVEEMQQEIPTYLNISQDQETGSHIEESWNR